MSKIWMKTKMDYGMNMEIPHSYNIANAMYGFRELGAEIVPYHTIDEIYELVTKEDIVLDYIDQSNQIFKKFGVEPHIPDYPDALVNYLGRKVWKDTINSISCNENKWSAGYFVKPTRDKAFTGKIIKSIADLVGCGNHSENYEVLVSEALDIKAEWRCFICYDKILDVRPYGLILDRNRDSYFYHYEEKVLKQMMEAFCSWNDRPMACSMDICVTGDGRTLLVELNDAYALAEGCGESLYGLEKFKKLKDLTVNCYDLKNIRSLSHCENLLRLNLKSSLLTDFDVLSELKNLEELIIDCEELKTLNFVKNMKQLHTLNVLSGLLLDIEALKNKDSLENLYLADKFEITDYTPIGTLSNLNQLTMYTDTSDIKSFKGLQKLTYLNVSGIWDFNEFSYMVNLKELTLSSSAYETIHLLKENKKLESIMIYEGLWLRNFNFTSLADIENLRKLHLYGDEDTACYHIDCVLNKDTLEDFKLVGAKIYLNKELLKKNLSLKVIYLELITIVKNGDDESCQEEKLSEALGFLAHYPNIERLSVIGSKLNSIECVKSLSHLRELEVTDNYISDFSVLNTLKEFERLICKKNATTNVELENSKVEIIQ